MPSHILVVEDERDLLRVLTYNLKQAGFDVVGAADGETALRAMREERFDLVLLDLMLPDIDGFEVCARLRADAATREVPVVVLSAVSDLAARQRATELGVQEYLVKPFDPERLMRVIRETLSAPDPS